MRCVIRACRGNWRHSQARAQLGSTPDCLAALQRVICVANACAHYFVMVACVTRGRVSGVEFICPLRHVAKGFYPKFQVRLAVFDACIAVPTQCGTLASQEAVERAVVALLGASHGASSSAPEVACTEMQLTVQTQPVSCGVHAVFAVERLMLFGGDVACSSEAGRAVAVAGATAWKEIDRDEAMMRAVIWLNLESARAARRAVWPRYLSTYVWQTGCELSHEGTPGSGDDRCVYISNNVLVMNERMT
jgi:hypothetical protein